MCAFVAAIQIILFNIAAHGLLPVAACKDERYPQAFISCMLSDESVSFAEGKKGITNRHSNNTIKNRRLSQTFIRGQTCSYTWPDTYRRGRRVALRCKLSGVLAASGGHGWMTSERFVRGCRSSPGTSVQEKTSGQGRSLTGRRHGFVR